MRNLILLSFLLIILSSCSKEPRPIHFGEDNCDYCRMNISDTRYGGELLTKKGKDYKFDSVECMTAYILKNKKGSDDIFKIWTIDFSNPEKFIDAEAAWYLHSDQLKSPMGLNLSSFSTQDEINSVQNVYPGEIIRWDNVKEFVTKEWLEK